MSVLEASLSCSSDSVKGPCPSGGSWHPRFKLLHVPVSLEMAWRLKMVAGGPQVAADLCLGGGLS